MSCILVGGGSRSGKSRYALEIARKHAYPLAFIATAEPGDDEMRDRIVAHRAERGPEFHTIEEPTELARALVETQREQRFGAIVVDCLTLWLSNRLLADAPDIREEFTGVLRAACGGPAPVILITNEVGCGIVPENALSRRFRDLAGMINAAAAASATETYWMMFGIPVRIK